MTHRQFNFRNALRSAKRMGRDAAEAVASWVEVNDADSARYLIEGFEDGDPEVYDRIAWPNLSGEWADAETPQSLVESVTGLDYSDVDSDDADAICEAWECGAAECESMIAKRCRYYLS